LISDVGEPKAKLNTIYQKKADLFRPDYRT